MYNYIVDSHCHLDLIEQKGLKIEDVINNAQQNQVKILQTICTKISQIDNILQYVKKGSNIYASIGTHPCNVNEEKLYSCEEIISFIKSNNKIVGIGETGLDYYHDVSFIDMQKKSFLNHILASQETLLPTIIHSRNADQDMIDILQNEQKNYYFPALLHCFSSGKDLAFKALDLGIFISISGIVTFKNAKSLQDIVKDIPIEFLLVETDSPYLAPHPFRSQTNQPSFTSNIVDFIAELKNVSRETLIDQTTKNFLKLFKRVAPLS